MTPADSPVGRAEALIRDAGDHAELGEFDAAERCIRRVIAMSAGDPAVASVVARELERLGLSDEATRLGGHPSPSDARERAEAERARARRERELVAVERDHRAMVARRPGPWHPEDGEVVALGDRLLTGGIELALAGDDVEAGRWLRAAYGVWPTVATSGAFAKLFLDRTADFDRGWRRPPVRVAPRPDAWDGRAPLRGRPLVYLSGGLGDQISELRWLRPLLPHHPWVAVGSPALARLAGRIVGADNVVVDEADIPGAPPVARMSASSWYVERGLTVASLDGRPYLSPDPLDVARWRRRIEASGRGLRVGLCWAAGSFWPQCDARSRTVGLAALAPLAEVPGVSFYSLQKTTPGSLMPDGYPPESEPAPPTMQLDRLGPDFRDLGDTAAAVACLDVVISVDTSVAHLAGAVGTPTWLLLSNPLDPRWFVGDTAVRMRTRWYDSVRIFRKNRPEGSWAPVIKRVAEALHELAAGRGAA